MVGRRGRFLVAEPLFERGAGRSRSAVGVRVRGGELVASQAHGARASVIAELGDPGVARDVAAALICERVGRARLRAAGSRTKPRRPPTDALAADSERRDLTALDTFTVDPATARDFDDAVSASEDGDGIRLWIHIADVAAHVRPGSGLDRRGGATGATAPTSPGRSSRCCPWGSRPTPAASAPGVDRLAVTAEILLGADGAPRSASFYRSRIRSDERLSYDQLDEFFAGRAAPPELVAEPLELARRAAAALARPPPRLRARDLDHRAGVRVRLRRRRRRGPLGRADRGARADRAADDLRQRAGRRALRAHAGCRPLYRVHERPDPMRVAALVGQARRARHPDAAAAQGDLVDLARPGGRAGRRGEPPGRRPRPSAAATGERRIHHSCCAP